MVEPYSFKVEVVKPYQVFDGLTYDIVGDMVVFHHLPHLRSQLLGVVGVALGEREDFFSNVDGGVAIVVRKSGLDIG